MQNKDKRFRYTLVVDVPSWVFSETFNDDLAAALVEAVQIVGCRKCKIVVSETNGIVTVTELNKLH